MATDDIKFRLTAEDATRTAFRSVEASLGRIKTEAATVAARWTAVGGALSIVGAGISLRNTVDEMAQLDDAAEKTGASVESLSSLLNTLKPSGIGLGEITDAASKLTRAMTGADEESSKAGDALRALQVSTRDAAGNLRPVDDVLVEIAKSLARYEDGTNKTAIAQRIFGKTGADLLPLLKDLASTQRAAASVTAEQAAAAEEFQKSIGRLVVQFEALKVELAGPLLGYLSNLVQQFQVGKEAAGGFFSAIGRYGTTFGSPEENIARLTARIDELNKKIKDDEALAGGAGGAFGRGARSAAAARAKELRAEVAQALRDLQYFRLLQEQAGNTNLRSNALYDAPGVRPSAPRLPSEDKAAKTRQSEAERLLETLNAQLDTARDLTREQEILAKIGRGEVEGLTPALEQQILLRAVQIDKLAEEKKATEALGRATADLVREYEQMESVEAKSRQSALSPDLAGWQRVADLLREVRGLDPTSKVRDQALAVANELLEKGIVTFDEYEKLGSKILELKDPIAEVKEASRDILAPLDSALEKAIFDFEDLSDVAKAFAIDFGKILLRQQVTAPLAGLLTGSFDQKTQGGTLVGLLASLFKAEGGSVASGRPYIVGERGPELFVPSGAGRIVPNRSLAGGGVVITQTITYGGNDRAGALQFAAAVKRDTLRAVREERERGAA